MKTVEGERVESLSVMLEFQATVLPETIKVVCMCFPVRQYIPPPLRCYKSQRYGHVAVMGKGNQRCPKCGEEHSYDECKNEKDTCYNYGGQHRVTYGCEIRKKDVEIEQIKVINNTSYAEAIKRAWKPKDVSGKVEMRPIPEQRQTGTDRVLTVEKLMLFIAHVINCTEQVKPKTEKIKIIVKGAEEFFGIKDMSWEHINKKLGQKGRRVDRKIEQTDHLTMEF